MELAELDARKAHEEVYETIWKLVFAVWRDGHDHGIGPLSHRPE
jgi:hypothetical protein